MKYIAALLVLFFCLPALAQTAQQVVPGYQVTGGSCPVGRVCWASTSTPKNSGSAEGSHVFKTTSGNLFGFSVTVGATAGFVLVYNATSAPTDGAVTPVACYAVAANTTLGVAYTPVPLYLDTGITMVFSSAANCFSQTTSASAFFIAETQ